MFRKSKGKWISNFLICTAWALLTLSVPLGATIFGSVRGIVHDPQHRPVSGATVTLKAQNSDWTQSQKTNDNGEFEFTAVAIGQYLVTVEQPGFAATMQSVVVNSGSAPVLHFELQLAEARQAITVSGEPVTAATDSVTPTSLMSREEIEVTPGADRTNSLGMITDFVPGAYVTHDQLHIRGGHQVSWLVDGVPVPNTNIASNLGPQFDPKDIDYMEVQRGSNDAVYGDRTYAAFNVVPRTGFERNRECDVAASFGNFYQSNDQINCGGHTQRFGYYGSVNANRSSLGNQPAVGQVIHDNDNGFGGFGSLIFNVDPKNQLRLVTSLRRDYYQIPVSLGKINEVDGSPGTIFLTPYPPGTFFQQDAEREADAFVNFSWVHTFNADTLLTLSPFFHYNSANYRSNPNDLPTATTNDRGSNYAGGQAELNASVGRNSINAGLYSFWQRDNQLFGVLFNDGSTPNFQDREIATGNLEEFFVEDKFKATSWLTFSGGVRQSHFSGLISENATSPRVGLAVSVPRLHWVFRGFYGHFYQAPPLLTFSGPALQNVAASQSFSFQPLSGERDEEHQFGVTIPLKGWSLDADNFKTRASNYFDHNQLGESNVFIPIALTQVLVRGWELTVQSPLLWRRGRLHMAYSNQIIEGRGAITGGLIPVPNPISSDYGPLDHDQRNTLNVGGTVNLPWRSYMAANVYYGSGFSNGNGPAKQGTAPCCGSLDWLPAHATLDLSAGKNFGEKVSVSVNGLNWTNRRLLLDDSLTFGGFHFSNPREIYVEVRYRLHY
jgi:carboxypeptidase family protein/TonB-dependent receptor-like protein